MIVYVGDLEIGVVEMMEEPTEFPWYGLLSDEGQFGPTESYHTDFYATQEEARTALVQLWSTARV